MTTGGEGEGVGRLDGVDEKAFSSSLVKLDEPLHGVVEGVDSLVLRDKRKCGYKEPYGVYVFESLEHL